MKVNMIEQASMPHKHRVLVGRINYDRPANVRLKECVCALLSATQLWSVILINFLKGEEEQSNT